jgi:hypothetical protein
MPVCSRTHIVIHLLLSQAGSAFALYNAAHGNLQDVPEGAVRFELEPAEIEEALAAPSMQVCVPPRFSKYLLPICKPNQICRILIVAVKWWARGESLYALQSRTGVACRPACVQVWPD